MESIKTLSFQVVNFLYYEATNDKFWANCFIRRIDVDGGKRGRITDKKTSYRIFEVLHQAGTKRLEISGDQHRIWRLR